MLKKVRYKLSLLGPSILWASAAIGVSHIVQSTRAGATYGYSLILIVILANVLKYPFFEFATRYTVVKNETVLDGYRRIGKWAIYLYTVLFSFSCRASVRFVSCRVGVLALCYPYSMISSQCRQLSRGVSSNNQGFS